MFLKKLNQLCEKHRGDNQTLDKIENILNNLSNYVSLLEKSQRPSDDDFETCFIGMQVLNNMCIAANTPEMFPKIETLDRPAIVKNYICGFSDEIIKNRRR